MSFVNADSCLFAYLRESGGSRDMAVVGGAGTDFVYEVASGKRAYINRINFVLRDAAIRRNRFGGIAELTNGLLIKVTTNDDVEILDFLEGESITCLDHFANLAGTDDVTTPTTGDDSWACRWTVSKAMGDTLHLHQGEKLVLTVQDDLSDLTLFYAMVQGRLSDV